MAEKIYKLGIDIGNKLVKIIGDEREQPIIYPSSLARYKDVSYIINNNIDYLEENGFELFSLEHDDEQSCYVWGRELYKFGQSVIGTSGIDELRYENQLFRKLVLFAIAKYAEGLYEDELTDRVMLSLAMGLPDDEYASVVANNYGSINWLVGEHVVFVDNLPVKFEIKKVELMPQEFGSLILFEKNQGGITPDVRTMVIDYGGVTRLRAVYDGFQQRDTNQDTLGVNHLITTLVDKINEQGIKNNRRNNQISVQEMLMSKNYKMKTGVTTEQDFTDLFHQEIQNYVKNRFEEDVYSGQDFNNIDLVILTGGGANLLDQSLYSKFGQEIWSPNEPETANVRGFYEYLKQQSPVEAVEDDGGEKIEVHSFSVGDLVKISENAVCEANGYDLIAHRNWEGKIVKIDESSNERFVYSIEYPSGEKNLYVDAKDLIKLESKQNELSL